MVTRELEHALDAGQWILADHSGDGGPFGFHYKVIHGKYVVVLSTGGVGFDDHLFPVTLEFKEPEKLQFLVGMYHNDDLSPVPIWRENTYEGPFISEWMDGPQWEVLLDSLPAAFEYAKWLEANLKP